MAGFALPARGGDAATGAAIFVSFNGFDRGCRRASSRGTSTAAVCTSTSVSPRAASALELPS
eukprot:1806882-Pyramimonas_sp.AAC.1